MMIPQLMAAQRYAELDARVLDLDKIEPPIDLPTMQAMLGCSRNALDKSRERLIDQGLILPRRTSGRFGKGLPDVKAERKPKRTKQYETREHGKPKPDKPPESKMRKCLMCGGEFKSEHNGDRVCKPCKSTAAWRGGQI